MHNLAIALSRKGMEVTGSDDEIFEPSRGRLKKEGILPERMGWNASNIHADLDAVILGMHARADNPELEKAKQLGVPIFSYPEYIFEQSKNKQRVVIGGSHGKTTITSMILHALKRLEVSVDYMVGAQLEGYDCMVKLTKENAVIILEGDEYLSSPIDRRPKFHLYAPHIALISGIAWDHINVFPTYENYVSQFEQFCEVIEPGGKLIYNETDSEVKRIASNLKNSMNTVGYRTPDYKTVEKGTILRHKGNSYPLRIFGAHNLQNLMGAMEVCNALGVADTAFLKAMEDFTGAGKRLEKVTEREDFVMYKDFAHSPSKLKATTSAVKEQYPEREMIACMELHTFSSLKKEFLVQYKGAMDKADHALVYFSHDVVAHKKLAPISEQEVKAAFGGKVRVATSTEDVLQFVKSFEPKNKVLLMMSSGNFDGIDYSALGGQL